MERLRAGLGLAMFPIGGLVGIVLAYFFYDVAQVRIDGFLFGGKIDAAQALH